MMVSQRGQPDHSCYVVAGILLAILIIIFIVLWRTDLARFYFYLFQILLQQ